MVAINLARRRGRGKRFLTRQTETRVNRDMVEKSARSLFVFWRGAHANLQTMTLHNITQHLTHFECMHVANNESVSVLYTTLDHRWACNLYVSLFQYFIITSV